MKKASNKKRFTYLYLGTYILNKIWFDDNKKDLSKKRKEKKSNKKEKNNNVLVTYRLSSKDRWKNNV